MHQIQLQCKLHFHAPHKSKQPTRIWHGDSTVRPRYCELAGIEWFQKLQKGSYHLHNLLLCVISQEVKLKSNVSSPSARGSTSNSNAIVKLIILLKELDNNQWPLYWFIIYAFIKGFKHVMIASTMPQTWAFRTQCKFSVFYIP